MKYEKSLKYDTPAICARIMGPHPIKLEEELLKNVSFPEGAPVLDLGSGQGVTSLFLFKEYGCTVFAADLWSDPTDNLRFFESQGVAPGQIVPIKADANELPFAHGFFGAVVCTDSYNYFGRDPEYLENKLLPFVKPGGRIYITIPGMKRDLHSDLPPELLLSWTPEQLDYIHDIPYWKSILARSPGARIVDIYEMESNDEVWQDWLALDNEYSQNDRKTMEAGGGKYLNFIAFVLERK